jgi:hypothetical protein
MLRLVMKKSGRRVSKIVQPACERRGTRATTDFRGRVASQPKSEAPATSTFATHGAGRSASHGAVVMDLPSPAAIERWSAGRAPQALSRALAANSLILLTEPDAVHSLAHSLPSVSLPDCVLSSVTASDRLAGEGLSQEGDEQGAARSFVYK